MTIDNVKKTENNSDILLWLIGGSFIAFIAYMSLFYVDPKIKAEAEWKCVSWIAQKYKSSMAYNTQAHSIRTQRGEVIVEVFGTSKRDDTTGQLMTCVYNHSKGTLYKPSIFDPKYR